MKIAFVLESINSHTNGTTATCLRFAKELEKKGHQIVLMGHEFKNKSQEPDGYIGFPHYTFPIFEGLILKEGFNFVKCDPVRIYDAIKDCDLVHLFLPFKFQNVTRLIANGLGIPVTGAYHLQPQNITSAIHIGHWKFANNVLFYSFKRYMYNDIRHIHCPSKMIANQMAEHRYKRNVPHVISNGITPFFHRVNSKKPEKYADKFVVCMSGRLASEKRQDLIIKAIAKSKYNDRIQVVLCGVGPNRKRYLKLAKKKGLANPLLIEFRDQDSLRELLSFTDVYVHASDFEVEGISAIEALACGAVPVISDSKLSATNAFALDERSIFRHGSVDSLREKIEYFFEHPKEREELSKAYIESTKQYALDLQVQAMEDMFLAAIEESKEGKDIPSTMPRKKDVKKERKLFKKIVKAGRLKEMPERLR